MYIDNKQLKNYISFWLASMFWIISTMIIVGGLTRLTDSGLSITKWQLFSGLLPPLNESQWQNYFDLYKKIPEFTFQNYSMSLQEFKVIFWWEWIHRFLGRLIGIIFLLPLLYFTFKVGFKNLKNLYFIFILICFQGFIGWYMGSSGLVDRVDVSHFRLSIHLGLALFLLCLIFWYLLEISNINSFEIKLPNFLLFSILTLIILQIILGSFLSGLDGGLIYNSWPDMNGSFFPNDVNMKDYLSSQFFYNPSIIQLFHRITAYILLLFIIILN